MAISAPTWLEDTPTRCRVFFSNPGPIANLTYTLGFFMSPNGNWWIPSLNVSEGRRPLNAGGDFVNIVAGTSMQHVVQPPGAAHANDFPFGIPANFGAAGGIGGPAMDAAAFPQGGSMGHGIDVLHAVGHVDHYEILVTINVQGPKITAYRISFTAEHIIPKVEKVRRQQKAAG